MSLGSRIAFATWRLYRTSALARRFLEPVVARSARRGLERHEEFVLEAEPSPAWAGSAASRAERRLRALLKHWGARVAVSLEGAPGGEGGAVTVEGAVRFEEVREGPTLEELAAGGHPIARRVYGDPPIRGLRARLGQGTRSGAAPSSATVALDARVLAPSFVTSPWGCVVADAIDGALGRADWRDPLPPLVSARIDDVTGERGLAWLRVFEESGIGPSIGTLHDRWLAGPSVEALVAASRRAVSVSPHAFDMDRFIWFDAPRGAPFSPDAMESHRARIERDIRATGLVLGKTLNAHFDVYGESALEAARALGFRYVLGEHEAGQDWREGPRARDPLGTPLYCYGRVGPLVAYQAEGAIASSAAPASRYDWLRNSLAVDRATNLPVKESLDRAGAVRQGVTQLLSALHGGFPAYLLMHELHLDALGADVVGELLAAVLREVRARAPAARPAPFDELPAACAARLTSSDPGSLAAAPPPPAHPGSPSY